MNMRRFVKAWLPLAILAVGLPLLVYAILQQDYRQSANDPQIQMTADAATALGGGASPQSVLPVSNSSGAESLAPFMIIYDSSGKLVATSIPSTKAVPALPDGVLAQAKNLGEVRFTWQPGPDLRLATVILHYTDKNYQASGYILAAKSLREIEGRENSLAYLTFGASLLLLILTALAVLGVQAL